MVTGISTKYFMPGADRDDMRQEAVVGLVKAIRSFDLSSDTPFVRFAALCVERGAMTAVHGSRRLKHRSLSESARVGRDADGEDCTITDLFPSPYSRDPFVVVCEKERLEALIRGSWTLTALEHASVFGIANGLPYRQIADEHGIGEKSVDNASARARVKLSRAFKEAA